MVRRCQCPFTSTMSISEIRFYKIRLDYIRQDITLDIINFI